MFFCVTELKGWVLARASRYNTHHNTMLYITKTPLEHIIMLLASQLNYNNKTTSLYCNGPFFTPLNTKFLIDMNSNEYYGEAAALTTALQKNAGTVHLQVIS